MLYKTKRKMTCFYTIEIPYYKTMQALFKDTNGIDGVCFNHTKSMIKQETEKLPVSECDRDDFLHFLCIHTRMPLLYLHWGLISLYKNALQTIGIIAIHSSMRRKYLALYGYCNLENEQKGT